eukprot:8294564-Alexandrium_andersonii.AAC.1
MSAPFPLTPPYCVSGTKRSKAGVARDLPTLWCTFPEASAKTTALWAEGRSGASAPLYTVCKRPPSHGKGST